MKEIRVLKSDNKYTINDITDSSWFRVFYEKKSLALVMSLETARQVIYRDIHERGGTSEYLHEEDFITKEKEA